MNVKLSRVLWIISGILLLMAGIFCMLSPGTALGTLSFLIGIGLIVSGVVNIVIYAKVKNFAFGHSWILAEGILSLLVGVLVLFNQSLTAFALPILFAIWIIYNGVGDIVGAFDAKSSGYSKWVWGLVAGIVLILLGLFALTRPAAGAITIEILVSVMLILRGIGAIVRGCMSRSLLR